MALRNGSRFGVSTQQVFPAGCHLLPDSIAEAMDYDEKTKTRRPAVDKVTGRRVWQCRVQDMDPDLAGRSRETVVKILADQMPSRRPAAVRGGGVRRPGGHPVRDRPRPPGVLAARDRHQGRPDHAAGQGRGVMPVKRVTALTVPVDGRSGVGLRVLPGPDSAADHHRYPPRAAGHPDPARAPGRGSRPVRPRPRLGRPAVRDRGGTVLSRPARPAVGDRMTPAPPTSPSAATASIGRRRHDPAHPGHPHPLLHLRRPPGDPEPGRRPRARLGHRPRLRARHRRRPGRRPRPGRRGHPVPVRPRTPPRRTSRAPGQAA